MTSVKKKTAQGKKAAPKKRTGAKARAKAVKSILLKVEKQLKGEEVKSTLGDYIKLLQLSKEMVDEPKTEIRVMWIEEPGILLIEE